MSSIEKKRRMQESPMALSTIPKRIDEPGLQLTVSPLLRSKIPLLK